jgi:3-hydroxyisobutyrate dehydrogenase
MGTGIARSLLRAEIDVTVWNRHSEKAAPLLEAGAVVAESPASAVRQADVVLTVLSAIGSKSAIVGEEPGGASALKLACNAWIASVTAAVGQSLAISRALGVDPRLFLTAINGGPSNAPYAQLKGDMMIDRDFSPAFAVDGILKDLDLMESELDGGSASTALLRTLRDLFPGHPRQGTALTTRPL